MRDQRPSHCVPPLLSVCVLLSPHPPVSSTSLATLLPSYCLFLCFSNLLNEGNSLHEAILLLEQVRSEGRKGEKGYPGPSHALALLFFAFQNQLNLFNWSTDIFLRLITLPLRLEERIERGGKKIISIARGEEKLPRHTQASMIFYEWTFHLGITSPRGYLHKVPINSSASLGNFLRGVKHTTSSWDDLGSALFFTIFESHLLIVGGTFALERCLKIYRGVLIFVSYPGASAGTSG